MKSDVRDKLEKIEEDVRWKLDQCSTLPSSSRITLHHPPWVVLWVDLKVLFVLFSCLRNEEGVEQQQKTVGHQFNTNIAIWQLHSQPEQRHLI